MYGTLLIWKPIKKSNDDIPPLIIEGKTFYDYRNIANIFYSCFKNVTDKMSENDPITNNVAANDAHPFTYLHQIFTKLFPNIILTLVSSKEITEIIKSLKWKNSYGYNEIPTKLLKISLPFIMSPLTYKINRLLSMGTFPA